MFRLPAYHNIPIGRDCPFSVEVKHIQGDVLIQRGSIDQWIILPFHGKTLRLQLLIGAIVEVASL